MKKLTYTKKELMKEARAFSIYHGREELMSEGTRKRYEAFCEKGNKVAVSGSIQIRQYEDRDGQKRTSVDVNADEVEFLTPKNAERDESDYVPAAKKKPALEEFEDDDIPF